MRGSTRDTEARRATRHPSTHADTSSKSQERIATHPIRWSQRISISPTAQPYLKHASRIEELLAKADIQVGGTRPWDITIHHPGLFERVTAEGSLGLGEAYLEQWWDCDALDEFFFRILRTGADAVGITWPDTLAWVRAKLLNLQHGRRAYRVGERHYDLGNDLFHRMLGATMMYSCGYWCHASTLDEAQEAKLDLVCLKLGLEPGMKVLDIGCGWGTALRYAARKYGIQGVGITISAEQAKYATEVCRDLPIEIRLEDYRSLKERFDRVFSIGMFEHVGPKNHREYMEVVRRCLADDGLALLHTIGNNRTSASPDPWLERYIFPNSALPSAVQIAKAMEGLFVLEDWHNFGADYDRTLMAWRHNFENGWSELRHNYDQRFYRMWTYYLLCCAGSFRARRNQVWQLVLSPQGVLGGYRSLRTTGPACPSQRNES